ncbi:PucR family transcriptional regulator [bacterium D16-54]|nr:PucR family transcriptional regulator [bacterium D16-54]RKJ14692.1 PucR family transcriptional regulator [bacterium D16-56]
MTKINEYISYPNIADLLQLPVLNSCTLLAGEKYLDNHISGINLSDTPEYQLWLQPYEILVTSCFSIHQDKQALSSFIPTLARKEISAVFIKPHQYLRQIPDYMIAQAQQFHIPLIELPPNIRFSAITKAVSDEIMRRHTLTLNNVISVNRVLTEIIINGAGLPEIARMISNLTGSSVLISDIMNGRQVCQISSFDEKTFLGMTWQEQTEALMAGSHIHNIQIDDTMFGYLYLYGNEHASYLDAEILKQILHTIPLEITREHSIHATLNNHLSQFILHLLSDQIIDEAWESTRAQQLGFSVKDAHIIALMKEDQRPGYDDNICEFHRSLLFNNIKSHFLHAGIKIHVVNTDTGHIIVLTLPPKQNVANLYKQIEAFARTFPSNYAALEIKIGLSRPHEGISGMIQGRREADIAFQASCHSKQDLFIFDHLGILRFIYSDNPEYEVSNFIQENLKGLTDISQPRNIELLRTLECYLDNQGNLKRISEELYTHYNTITYRLKTIQKLLDKDLHKSSDRFQLNLALRLFHSTVHPEAFPSSSP